MNWGEEEGEGLYISRTGDMKGVEKQDRQPKG